MVDASFFQPGRVYCFQYPRHNFHGVSSGLEVRHVRVTELRDLTVQRLEQASVDVQPLLRRSRWLLTGLDLDKNLERSFYLRSIKEAEELREYQPSSKCVYCVARDAESAAVDLVADVPAG